ncbi:MAG: 50S ribosomal protein L25 [Patescibacteria group bacterium]
MTLKLDSKVRSVVGKKVSQLRKAGKIPAILYGHGTANQNLELAYNDFEKIFKEAGESTIIDVAIDGQETVKAIISDLQYDPVKHVISHVDLRQVRMDEEIEAHVALKFIGEPKIIKEDGGSLVHNMTEIEIRCLPGDLIHEIEIDVSDLASYDDVITIKDLPIPSKVKIVDHEPDDVVAMVARQREEKEEVVVAPVVEGATPEGQPATEESAKPVKEEKK